MCRAKIEEISGEKQCVGPRGDVLDTIQRRNFTVAVESDGYLYLVKASALESRWDQVGRSCGRLRDRSECLKRSKGNEDGARVGLFGVYDINT